MVERIVWLLPSKSEDGEDDWDLTSHPEEKIQEWAAEHPESNFFFVLITTDV